VPVDHEVRAIAAVVDKLDLRGLYADLRARGEIAGAPATDPKILLGCGSTPPPDAKVEEPWITASTTFAATTVTCSASS
jgi:hypothetical protein